MDSIKAFITTKRINGFELVELIPALIENFPKEIENEEKAKEILEEWNSEVKLKLDSYGNKSRMIDSNPGFETIIRSDIKAESTYTILTVYDINNIAYLEHIDIYISAIFELLQNKRNISEDIIENIDKLCLKKTKRLEKMQQAVDIQAEQEQKSGKLVFVDQDDEDEDDDDDFFDDDDFSEDENEDENENEDGKQQDKVESDYDGENFDELAVAAPDITPFADLTKQPIEKPEGSATEVKLENTKTSTKMFATIDSLSSIEETISPTKSQQLSVKDNNSLIYFTPRMAVEIEKPASPVVDSTIESVAVSKSK